MDISIEEKLDKDIEELEQLSLKFKMLSEPSRLKILRCLTNGEKCVTEIIEETKLMQANVSKQLKLLQYSGMIKCKPMGLKRIYKLTDNTLMNICLQFCPKLETE